MKLAEIAGRINAHLKRFEADKKINAERINVNSREQESRLKPYYWACAFASGRYVGVKYISYQTTSYLPKADALKYLEWLDAGNVGRHYEALRDGKAA